MSEIVLEVATWPLILILAIILVTSLQDTIVVESRICIYRVLSSLVRWAGILAIILCSIYMLSVYI
jgi:hypothetical protein